MGYPSRISLALTLACLLVLGSLALLPRLLQRIDAVAAVPAEHAIHFDLRRAPPPPPPPRRDPPKRLIDAGAPAEAPVKETDLISSQASQAQDMSDHKRDLNRPAAKEVDEFDQLGTPPSPPPSPDQKPAAAPAEPKKEAKPAEAAAPARVSEDQPKPMPEQPPLRKEPGVAVAQAKPPVPTEKPARKPTDKTQEETVAKEQPTPTEKPEQFKVAAAKSAPPVPVQELRAEKGREGGGAEKSGFTSFEANKHVLGEYMLKVRNRVEREWRTALHLRYAGASRTSTTIHCVIRPDGTIESVSILEPGDSLTYAVLCRDAVERAGPFGPFPFDVPEIYRSENLEINWKFSYL